MATTTAPVQPFPTGGEAAATTNSPSSAVHGLVNRTRNISLVDGFPVQKSIWPSPPSTAPALAAGTGAAGVPPTETLPSEPNRHTFAAFDVADRSLDRDPATLPNRAPVPNGVHAGGATHMNGVDGLPNGTSPHADNDVMGGGGLNRPGSARPGSKVVTPGGTLWPSAAALASDPGPHVPGEYFEAHPDAASRAAPAQAAVTSTNPNLAHVGYNSPAGMAPNLLPGGTNAIGTNTIPTNAIPANAIGTNTTGPAYNCLPGGNFGNTGAVGSPGAVGNPGALDNNSPVGNTGAVNSERSPGAFGAGAAGAATGAALGAAAAPNLLPGGGSPTSANPAYTAPMASANPDVPVANGFPEPQAAAPALNGASGNFRSAPIEPGLNGTAQTVPSLNRGGSYRSARGAEPGVNGIAPVNSHAETNGHTDGHGHSGDLAAGAALTTAAATAANTAANAGRPRMQERPSRSYINAPESPVTSYDRPLDTTAPAGGRAGSVLSATPSRANSTKFVEGMPRSNSQRLSVNPAAAAGAGAGLGAGAGAAMAGSNASPTSPVHFAPGDAGVPADPFPPRGTVRASTSMGHHGGTPFEGAQQQQQRPRSAMAAPVGREGSLQGSSHSAYLSPRQSMRGQRLPPIADDMAYGAAGGAGAGLAVGEVASLERQHNLQNRSDSFQLRDEGPVPPYPPGYRHSSMGHHAGGGGGDWQSSGRLQRSGTALSRTTVGRNASRRSGAFGRGAGMSVGTLPEDVLGRDEIHSRTAHSERVLDKATLRKLGNMEKKDARKLAKLLKEEGKEQARAVEIAIKDLKRIARMQKDAIEQERKSQHVLSKWTSTEHRARKRFLKEKERYEKVEGELRNAENDYEERRDHAAGLTEQIAEKTQELDDMRANKAADDREREVKLLALKNPGHV